MSVEARLLAERAADVLASPEGEAALGRAVRAVLTRRGAPTRPGGRDGPLAERLIRGEPLAEDTDWRSPLGPFRDPNVQAGTLGELCAARLSAGAFAGDVLLALLATTVREQAGEVLAGALDAADADDACRAAVADLLGGSLRARPLAPLAVRPSATADR